MSRRGQGGRSTGKAAGSGSTPCQFVNAATTAGLSALPGKGALDSGYRPMIEARNASFTASLDMDKAFISSEPQAPRWDYGIGTLEAGDIEKAFWLEPHPASSTSEVQRMLAKLEWLKAKLALPQFAALRQLTQRAGAAGNPVYIWLHSGANRISPHSREAKLLASKGLSLPRRHVTLP